VSVLTPVTGAFHRAGLARHFTRYGGQMSGAVRQKCGKGFGSRDGVGHRGSVVDLGSA
jgi:hypothetical protein